MSARAIFSRWPIRRARSGGSMTQLTTERGAAIADNQNSQTAGPAGPTLLQDQYLIEKLARFNRERIPERRVHAVGTAAYGYLEVTSADVPKWTKMKIFEKVGKKTDMFIRFSTVASSRGGPDVARDPRGFAMKYYTEDGTWDLVGNNTPVFFIRDGIKFPDFIHSQKQDPFTNRQEPDNVWDFFSHSPEATHQFVILFSDRGIPASYRCMDGFGSHTFLWVNARGERHWVKFHFKTNQGIKCFTSEEAVVVGGQNQFHCHKDLYDAIERKDFPSWTLSVQAMPEADAATYRVDPFDVTKVWNHKDYPLIPIGKMGRVFGVSLLLLDYFTLWLTSSRSASSFLRRPRSCSISHSSLLTPLIIVEVSRPKNLAAWATGIFATSRPSHATVRRARGDSRSRLRPRRQPRSRPSSRATCRAMRSTVRPRGRTGGSPGTFPTSFAHGSSAGSPNASPPVTAWRQVATSS